MRRRKKKGEERENEEEEEKHIHTHGYSFCLCQPGFNIHAETTKSEQWENYTLDSMQG